MAKTRSKRKPTERSDRSAVDRHACQSSRQKQKLPRVSVEPNEPSKKSNYAGVVGNGSTAVSLETANAINAPHVVVARTNDADGNKILSLDVWKEGRKYGRHFANFGLESH